MRHCCAYVHQPGFQVVSQPAELAEDTIRLTKISRNTLVSVEGVTDGKDPEYADFGNAKGGGQMWLRGTSIARVVISLSGDGVSSSWHWSVFLFRRRLFSVS